MRGPHGAVPRRDGPAQQKAWFDQHVRPWLAASPAAHKILTWGNHDWCGQARNFEGDSPEAASSTALQILVDTSTSVPGNGAAGRSISVWATPWSRQFMNWAFMRSREELAETCAAIPEDVDILVSHQPPYGCGVEELRVGHELDDDVGKGHWPEVLRHHLFRNSVRLPPPPPSNLFEPLALAASPRSVSRMSPRLIMGVGWSCVSGLERGEFNVSL